MAEEVVTSTGTGEVAEVVETGGDPSSLIDVVAEKPVETVVTEGEAVGTTEEGEEVEGEETDTNVDVEEVLKDFGDLMEEGQLNTILGDFNEGKITGKALITKILNEVGIAKDQMNEKIDSEIQTVKQNLVDKPIEGVDLADLGGWVSKQGEDMVKIASTLTDFSLGEDAVRSAIKLLNRIRMGKPDVGDPEVKIVQKASVSRDTLREEYMSIYQTKEGIERVLGIENLVKKAEKTGDKELIDWAKGMFN